MCPYKILLNEVINLDLQLKRILLRVSLGLETFFFHFLYRCSIKCTRKLKHCTSHICFSSFIHQSLPFLSFFFLFLFAFLCIMLKKLYETKIFSIVIISYEMNTHKIIFQMFLKLLFWRFLIFWKSRTGNIINLIYPLWCLIFCVNWAIVPRLFGQPYSGCFHEGVFKWD